MKEKQANFVLFSKKLDSIQRALLTSPTNEYLYREEKECKQHIFIYWQDEESALKQKSRDQCILLGDSNSKDFYNLMRVRRYWNANNISSNIGKMRNLR